MSFQIKSKFKPAGDQPQAIAALSSGLKKGYKHQTLLGVTGSGKTFTMAGVIELLQRPTLVIAHNKTLAAQLVSEFREFFPESAVEYFVSYYDYYQPEAYMPTTDTYIEKEVEINQEIEKLRHRATASLTARRDVIVVSSVSCIYGLGSPEAYRKEVAFWRVGDALQREDIIEHLVGMYYERSEVLAPGKFRVVGEVFEIAIVGEDKLYRLELEEGKLSHIVEFEALTRKKLSEPREVMIFPAKHFVVEEGGLEKALGQIEEELKERLEVLKKANKWLEAERLQRRTRYDLEMIRELGYCNGIENYSRYLTGRAAGETPYTLLDYFPADFLLFIDESHVTLPQLRAMYNGDKARKTMLVEHGFRLPSALDNRPLTFAEFQDKVGQVVYVSATPATYEKEISRQTVEQIVRPTGLLDPEIEVRPLENQVEDLVRETQEREKRGERVLVTTLTKKMAEDLHRHLEDLGVKSQYLHSDVDTLDRIRILKELREGKFDCLVGVNLLREGLDLPEVTLVGILDADKEGFLRSETSLIQTIGRAARNVSGKVILYADNITSSMHTAISETRRRRKLQEAYNRKHGITPRTIEKQIKSIVDHELVPEVGEEFLALEKLEDIPRIIKEREKEMKRLSKELRFEEAALVRDEVLQLKRLVR